MKTFNPFPATCFLLALSLLTACSAARRDRLWRTIDPAGYKHAHSESFNGDRALRSPETKANPKDGNMPLELDE